MNLNVSQFVTLHNQASQQFRKLHRKAFKDQDPPCLQTFCLSDSLNEKQMDILNTLKAKYPDVTNKKFHLRAREILTVLAD